MPIEDYSTTPAENTALMPENMNPSAVNDGVRQIQADIKAKDQDPFWHNLGNPSGVKVGAYLSATQITTSGNQTGEYHVGRRIRVDYPAAATRYGTITAVSHASGPDVTTVTIRTNDGAALSNATGTLYLGPSARDITCPTVVDGYYTSGTVRLQEIRANGVMIGGIDYDGTTLSLVTD